MPGIESLVIMYTNPFLPITQHLPVIYFIDAVNQLICQSRIKFL
jgi:hypothetical protein